MWHITGGYFWIVQYFWKLPKNYARCIIFMSNFPINLEPFGHKTQKLWPENQLEHTVWREKVQVFRAFTQHGYLLLTIRDTYNQYRSWLAAMFILIGSLEFKSLFTSLKIQQAASSSHKDGLHKWIGLLYIQNLARMLL